MMNNKTLKHNIMHSQIYILYSLLHQPFIRWIDQSENSSHNIEGNSGTLMCVYNVVYKIESQKRVYV